MPELHVGEVMSEGVVTVAPDCPASELAARMRDRGLSCVVVCEGRRPIGVISERDMARLCAELLAGGDPPSARDLMSPRLWTANADASCSECTELLRERSIRRLVIVGADGNLAGIVTQTDLLDAHARALEAHRRELEARVQKRTLQLEEANSRLESLALVDALLGIGNRRAMDDTLDKLQQLAARYRRPYAVALIDVDHFKKYNDHYGHPVGDTALVTIARAIESSTRVTDGLYRYGGEEFLIALPEIDVDGAAVVAEKVRGTVARLEVPHQHSPIGRLSVSVGVAVENLDAPSWPKLVAEADEALYRAKTGGRDRVEAAAPTACPVALSRSA